MTLLAPSRLWLLLAVGVLAVAYVALQRSRRQLAVRHPDVRLVAAVSAKRPGWRRHVTAAGLALAVVALVGGLARPAYSAEVPRKEAVVVLAIDVSGSMGATDVAPTRLQAAVAAARKFIAAAPSTYKIGLVSFDTAGHTLATPSTDRTATLAALSSLRPSVGTAAGEGLVTAVDLIKATTGEASVGAGSASTDKPYGAVVLLTDGASTRGRSLTEASKVAAKAKVPVFAIAYGTPTGTVTINGETSAVPADPPAMAAVAKATGGSTYTATSAAQLSQVYDRIGTHISSVTEQVELTTPLAAMSAALLALAFVATMLWSPRLV